MDLKDFLGSRYDQQKFERFISERFYGFEPSLAPATEEGLNESEKKHIQNYRYLGSVELDDGKEIGFFEFLSHSPQIENKRVGYNAILKKLASEYLLDGAIASFSHPQSNAWRLSFVGFEFEDGGKQNVTNLKRFTYVLGDGIPVKTPLIQLKNLKYPTLKEIEEAFSVEAVTKEFYKGLEELYFKLLNQYLYYPEDDENKQKEFAIKLIGRVIFIKFLEKKGLIPSNIFKIKRSYYFEVLEPLFFEQLNKPNKNRFEKFKNDYIPFLNGGLFEPIKDIDYYEFDKELQERIPPINVLGKKLKIDDIFFEELYEHFSKFNFTIDENSPDDNELSIDPEMLGRIFENFIAEINPETSQNARKATGSYYTPREIVEYMVNQSTLEYLKTNTSIDENILKDIVYEKDLNLEYQQKSEILTALFKIKVLDPACGSGAFPMGMLQKIVRILNQIDENSEIWFKLQDKKFKEKYKYKDKNYFRKLSIINNSIFGVDIQPFAIEIAKLRFFLSLVVDEEIDDKKENRGIEPLPNLEFKFVCANTLIPLEKSSILASSKYYEYEYRLKELKTTYFLSFGEEKEKIKKEYLDTREKLFQEIEEISLGEALTSKLANYNPFDPLSVAEFFDSEFVFNIKNGFDIVIGNPPYIKEYTNKSAFNGLHKLECYQGKMDIWYLFACRGIELLKVNGVLSFIATNNWVTNTGAKKFRKKILESSKILEFIDFKDYKIFSAGIQTMIFFLKKEKPIKNYMTNIKILKDYRIKINELKNFLITSTYGESFKSIIDIKSDTFHFIKKEIFEILEKIEKKRNFYLTEKEIIQGIVVPQDILNKKNALLLNLKVGLGIFVLTKKELYDLKLTKKEMELIKPYYTSEEVKKYYTKKQNSKYIIYTTSKFKNPKEIKPYPNIKKHLDKFQDVITSDNKPYGLHRARNEKFFKGEKIIVQRKCPNEPIFSYSNFDTYLPAMYYIVKTSRINLKYLLALFNSKLFAFWLKYKGKMQGDNYQLDKEPLLNLPIVKINNIKLFETLIDYIMWLKVNKEERVNEFVENEHIVKLFEDIIDAMVLELYFKEESKEAGFDFIAHAIKLFKPIENLPDNQIKQTISHAYQTLREKDNPIRNDLQLLPAKVPLVAPILESV